MYAAPGGDAQEDEGDGIILDEALFQTAAVRTLEDSQAYKTLSKQTVKQRRSDGKNDKEKVWKEMRQPIRVSAAAARKAYTNAAKAQPVTPDLLELFEVFPQYIRCLCQGISPGKYARCLCQGISPGKYTR